MIVSPEKYVLSCILTDLNAAPIAINILGEKVDIFEEKTHQNIYKVILHVNKNDETINLLTVMNASKKLKLNISDSEVIDLTLIASSSAEIESQCFIILEKSRRKRIMKLLQKGLQSITDESKTSDEIKNLLEKEFLQLDVELENKKDSVSFSEVVSEVIQNLDEKELVKIPIPIEKINTTYNGWQLTDLVIIGARPSHGKSAIMNTYAYHSAKCGIPTAIFSLEMKNSENAKRTIANAVDLDFGRIMKPKYLTAEDQMRIEEAKKMDIPLYYEDKCFHIREISNKIKVLKLKKDVKIVFIDYLGLVVGDKAENRNNELAKITRELKMLAQTLDICIVAASQLNRGVEKDKVRAPMLSDLRDSGAVEQDANIVQLIYSPSQHGIEKWEDESDTIVERDHNGFITKRSVEIITAKSRNGETFSTRVVFDGRKQRFHDENYTPDLFIINKSVDVLPKVNPISPTEAFGIGNEDDDNMPF